MHSLCRDDGTCKARQPHPYAVTATPRPRRLRGYFSSTLNTVLLTVVVVVVVVVGLATPVRGGLMDFSAPDVIQYGTCAQPKDQESFDFRQFSGFWYQVEMVPNSYMEAIKCITLNFKFNGGECNVTTQGLNEYNEHARQDAIITRVLAHDPATSRPFLQIWAPAVPPVPYHVVKTDYHHFACVYSCYELFSLMFEAFSVLSRRPEMDEASLAACHRAFSRLDLDLSRLKPVKQDGPCLGNQVEGSGEEPVRQNEEDEDDENALAPLTSEEVNQRGAPNAASAQRSEPAVDEDMGETMMEVEAEEEQEEVVEVQGGGGGGGERGGMEVEETFSLTDRRLVLSRNHTGGEEGEEGLNKAKERKNNRGYRRKQTKGGRQEGSSGGGMEDNSSMASPDLQLYLDVLHLDALYYNEETGRGGGGGGRGEASAATHLTHDRLYGGAGGGAPAPGPASLLLVSLLSLSVCAWVPPTP